jgi:hypothetical protein
MLILSSQVTFSAFLMNLYGPNRMHKVILEFELYVE